MLVFEQRTLILQLSPCQNGKMFTLACFGDEKQILFFIISSQLVAAAISRGQGQIIPFFSFSFFLSTYTFYGKEKQELIELEYSH